MIPTSYSAMSYAGLPAGQALGLRSLDRAILQALAYADVFDYALRVDEIRRYMLGVAAPRDLVQAALRPGGDLLPDMLVRCGEHYALRQREVTVELRRERAELAAQLWPRAIRYAHIIGEIPFVQMVAVTGALAVDNVAPGADIDYLIVTEPGRLWLCRALIIALVRLAARTGDVICPNYLISSDALAIPSHTLYTAHELAQMVPVSGHATYRLLRQANPWAERLLPNAAGQPHTVAEAAARRRLARGAAEALLRGRVGGLVEGWEMRRKIRKLSRRADGSAEVAFCADWCKGHFGGHGQRTMTAYKQRLEAMGLT